MVLIHELATKFGGFFPSPRILPTLVSVAVSAAVDVVDFRAIARLLEKSLQSATSRRKTRCSGHSRWQGHRAEWVRYPVGLRLRWARACVGGRL